MQYFVGDFFFFIQFEKSFEITSYNINKQWSYFRLLGVQVQHFIVFHEERRYISKASTGNPSTKLIKMPTLAILCSLLHVLLPSLTDR